MDRRSEGQLSRRPETVATREKKNPSSFFAFLPSWTAEFLDRSDLSVCMCMCARARALRLRLRLRLRSVPLGGACQVSRSARVKRKTVFWPLRVAGGPLPTSNPLHCHHRNPICFSSRSRVFWLSGETPSVGSDSEVGGVGGGRAGADLSRTPRKPGKNNIYKKKKKDGGYAEKKPPSVLIAFLLISCCLPHPTCTGTARFWPFYRIGKMRSNE